MENDKRLGPRPMVPVGGSREGSLERSFPTPTSARSPLEVLRLLAAAFPASFFIYERRRLPPKIGIRTTRPLRWQGAQMPSPRRRSAGP